MNVANIRRSSREFHILHTTPRTQTATIRLADGAATSDEPSVHAHSEQTVVLLEGELIAEIEGDRQVLGPGDCVIVPAGARHRFVHTGEERAFAFTCYTPPAYPEES